MSLRRALLGALLSACAAVSTVALPPASATGDTGRYVGGGTAVVRANGQPAADEGSVVCDNGDGAGAGGLCLRFGGGDAVHVVDELAGENVAFQVCIDNSGDGVCTSPDTSPICPDQIAFSHDDAGNFYNPVGPLPTGFLAGCAGGPWKGYVVLLCEGVHAAGVSAHSHEATSGTGTVTTGGEGLGTFCGGGPQPSRKRYTVGSGARYVSGGTAVAREDGKPAVDEGSVVCNNGDNVGVGGFCVSFGGGDAVAVFDATAGENVAFQVCIDNSGDGVCTSPDARSTCPDKVVFSHNDAGQFFNPVGPLPTGFTPGCAGGPWNGYVVFLCEGTHVDGLDAHTHTATTGTGLVTTGGEGKGTFCGGTHQAPTNKRYALDPGDHSGFAGGCSARGAQNDTLTGQSSAGAVSVAIAATSNDGQPAPTAPITNVQCELIVDGISRGIVLTAPDGTGVTANAGPFSFSAGPDDDARLCTTASVQGTVYRRCEIVVGTSLVPDAAVDAVRDAGDVLAGILAGGDTCARLLALAPVVNAAHQPGVAFIDTDGDLYVLGSLFYDCPPF